MGCDSDSHESHDEVNKPNYHSLRNIYSVISYACRRVGVFFIVSGSKVESFGSRLKTPLAILALLCATAQQSYCRHAAVRRPSVVRPSVKLVKQAN